MKIKTKELSYEEVLALPREKHRNPMRQTGAVRLLLKAVSFFDLRAVGFTFEKTGMEKLGAKEPCLILMNHSSFIDLKIVATLLSDREYHIVCTQDGFVGKRLLMRLLGCIPAKKFINDITLIKDMRYTLQKLHASVLMYPEASYSFDGTETPLPDSLGKCIKLLKVPVIMLRTYGAFLRDPLYNGLQLRKTKVSAKMEYLLSPEEIAEKSTGEINEIPRNVFSFDYFKEQQEQGILIKEPFRADGLQRALYRCPHCQTEGMTEGKGTRLICHACGISYELSETGYLKADFGETCFSHIPDWYRWERECVRKELADGSYRLDLAVDIYMLTDTRCVYKVGEGRLLHTTDGFELTGCDGKLEYKQLPQASYSLYSDFYWYEIGDMISIGDAQVQYYCFPKHGENVVAKTRLATEELYRMKHHGIG